MKKKPNCKYFLIYTFLLSLFINSCQPDQKTTSGQLKIATLNCEFLWDGIEPEEGNPAVTFPHKGNTVLARQHMKEISIIIREINADIINLVEVEGIEALHFLKDTFLYDLGYEIGFAEGTDTYTGQDVAVLSKYPIKHIYRYDKKGISGEVEKSVSKNYVAEIEVDNTQLAVIGLHFLSQPLDISRRDERQAQADAIKDIALKKKKEGFELVIAGDFNDYDGDSCCIDINNHLPVTKVLSIIKNLDETDTTDDLVNVSSNIIKEYRYTSHTDADKEGDIDKAELSSIDHLLVSQYLASKIVKAEIKHSYNPLEITDHFPVIAEFDFSLEE